MPIINGDSTQSATPLLSSDKVNHYATALGVLEKEYPEHDGIDARTLLDSSKRGGLTYNDFLVLPGFIGAHDPRVWKFQSQEFRL